MTEHESSVPPGIAALNSAMEKDFGRLKIGSLPQQPARPINLDEQVGTQQSSQSALSSSDATPTGSTAVTPPIAVTPADSEPSQNGAAEAQSIPPAKSIGSLSNNTPIAASSPIRARDFISTPVRSAPPPPTSSQSTTPTTGRPPVGRATPSMVGQHRIPPSLQAKMAALAQRSSSAQNLSQGSGSASSSLTSSADGSSGSDGTRRLNQTSSSAIADARSSIATHAGAARSSTAGMGASNALAATSPGGALARRRPVGGLTLGGLESPNAGPSVPGRQGSFGTPSVATARLAVPGQRPGGASPVGGLGGRRKGPPPGGLSGMRLNPDGPSSAQGTPFSNFSKIVDPSGRLNFANKAVLHEKGVDFTSGASFAINMQDLTLEEELGKGNYGTVQKVFHKATKVTMAMKEIRLELDDSKLKAIITELDILHRATAPEIVDFYGAFFIESCVYYCMEYMDAGSLDKLGGLDVPEPVLARVTSSMVKGLRFLKDELQTMHRDVKPTNVLVNTQGMVKLCDFGVSGQLERSLAKTNIGCQSYMAPERIKGESQGNVATYTVASDVWSLGLSIIEFTLGHYPYPPETYTNVFAQLQAIVHGDPPALPVGYSAAADDFVAATLEKVPQRRPTYAELLQHPFLLADEGRDVNMVAWVQKTLEAKAALGTGNVSSSAN
ncbi:uncharacterized protein L969DRAFT_87300 [Mixia osmundae IAM 14324]|nr:uncharacterized protein L969DRAFT_87300 [Mixia osmundae IAM 14324]KEI39349.1 hypothetical protein L969DRAFT_87300 [Mixia osmundae IAM 14324]